MNISRFSSILQAVYHTLIFAPCQHQNANNFVHRVDISYCELIDGCALGARVRTRARPRCSMIAALMTGRGRLRIMLDLRFCYVGITL